MVSHTIYDDVFHHFVFFIVLIRFCVQIAVTARQGKRFERYPLGVDIYAAGACVIHILVLANTSRVVGDDEVTWSLRGRNRHKSYHVV